MLSSPPIPPTYYVVALFCASITFFFIVLAILRQTGAWPPGLDFMRYVTDYQRPYVQELSMTKVDIPFTISICNTSQDDTIEFNISSNASYEIISFWGVSISELHHSFRRPWRDINSEIEAGILLEGHYQCKGLQITNHDPMLLKMIIPSEYYSIDLVTTPRPYYPLVVIIKLKDTELLQDEEAVALVSVIHVHDDVCPHKTGILAQYLKQAYGNFSVLQQMYVTEGVSTETNTEDLPCQEEEKCVVCQYFTVTRVLLPCRHACVCRHCFLKLTTCPLCRSFIQAYFCIKNENSLSENEIPDNDLPDNNGVYQRARNLVRNMFN